MSSLGFEGEWLVSCPVDEVIQRVGEDRVRTACFFRAQRKLPRASFDRLLEALRLNSTVEIVDLDHCEVAQWPGAVAKLLAACAAIPSLIGINLNACQVTDDDAVDIANFLSTDPPLRRLWLYSNQITILGATALYEAITTRNSTLEHLDLRNNGVPDSQQSMLFAEACRHPARPLRLKEQCRLSVLRHRVRYKPHVTIFERDVTWDVAAAAEAALAAQEQDDADIAGPAVGTAVSEQGRAAVERFWARGHAVGSTLTQRGRSAT
eukprot:TRINITY_DN36896_c0_g1_i1.p1 TRINITY_DN36896_c0_g1~~TRINITY_DN36896_c0_g1_i1.p1  ORF type:complete len:265 (+),score=60.90 TRINITY_DN36896_c0_g1_i1:57-851(+)